MHKRKIISLFAGLVAFASGLTAQDNQGEIIITPNDPIVIMLDSMVTLNNVIRFNEV